MIEQAFIKTLGFDVKEFIEKAIEGGWLPRSTQNILVGRIPVSGVFVEIFSDDPWISSVRDRRQSIRIEEIMLDPLAWQAVGKVDGWSGSGDKAKDNLMRYSDFEEQHWKTYMHRFIDALIETV